MTSADTQHVFKILKKQIEENYTFKESQEIITFLEEKRLDIVIGKTLKRCTADLLASLSQEE